MLEPAGAGAAGALGAASEDGAAAGVAQPDRVALRVRGLTTASSRSSWVCTQDKDGREVAAAVPGAASGRALGRAQAGGAPHGVGRHGRGDSAAHDRGDPGRCHQLVDQVDGLPGRWSRAATVDRIWQAFGLKPHLSETFKLSTDPFFVEKVRDVVGLYLDPPDRALVLCVDEKSQMQALDRSAPVLPILPGRRPRMTHDYIRHGTTSLFAALDVATGKVIGASTPPPRDRVPAVPRPDRPQAPSDLDLHLVLDNYATHKTPTVDAGCSPSPVPPALHPKRTSWLNLVERWFAESPPTACSAAPSTPASPTSTPTSAPGSPLERRPPTLRLA